MPVQKFRSVEEMPRPERVVAPDLADRIRALWRRARLLSPPAPMKRGVTRFRSIEEANAAREQATRERMRASRA
jgi:hypothetical protein